MQFPLVLISLCEDSTGEVRRPEEAQSNETNIDEAHYWLSYGSHQQNDEKYKNVGAKVYKHGALLDKPKILVILLDVPLSGPHILLTPHLIVL
jgi:hypothetical protein